MGSIALRKFTTATGVAFQVRTAVPDDAAEFLACCRAVADEAKYILTQPDEFPTSVDEEQQWLQSYLDQQGRLALVAEAAVDSTAVGPHPNPLPKGEGTGATIGCLGFENGPRRRNAHQGTLGMSVRERWQRIGVGTALMQCLLDWAEATPLIEKVGLAVFADNLPAIGLYRKFGFIEEGRQPRQIKMGPDAYQDVVLMYRCV